MSARHVPLAVDAQIRVPVGPALIPLRGLCALLAAAPAALVVLGVDALAITYRAGVALCVLVIAFGISTPNREGVWIVTWWTYRAVQRMLPTAVVDGRRSRASVEPVGRGLRIGGVGAARSWGRLGRSGLSDVLAVPRAATEDDGVLTLAPGGCRALLMLQAPATSPATDRYDQWCSRVIRWLLATECPAQLLTVLDHHDAQRAQLAFDRRVEHRRTPLHELERDLLGRVAEQSVRFRHFVVLAPGLAAADGLPAARVANLSRLREASADEAARVRDTAVRIAQSLGLEVAVCDRDDAVALISRTLPGAVSAAVSREGDARIGEESEALLTVLRLPPRVLPGMFVESLLRVRMRGMASLHVFPVDAVVARRILDRRAAMQRYTAREGNDSVDNQVSLAETSSVLASIAQQELRPCRLALTLAVRDPDPQQLSAATQRILGQLSSSGFAATQVTAPGFLPTLAASPGGTPLRRSLLLTSDGVAACLLPALGTPYADHREPLLGLSATTCAPVHLSVWSRPNHNALVLGSSGAGKSVAAKTMLVRHLMEGACAIVIDPDSEYRRVMNAVGGRHFELGDEALNVLAACRSMSADSAASTILPVLSVMAGDEKGFRDGRPIRRLADEDQAWLHGEVADFLRRWSDRSAGDEPLIRDLVGFLERNSAPRALTAREEERCRILVARLRRYTQGHRAPIFDRPSTFAVGGRPVAIGLRTLAMSYAADLTPALALILTAVMSSFSRETRRTVIVVDEAHRVTADPDAGEVLAQLVRQGRKHAAGVWMCSQRIDDFIGTDLGRTLAATASTKLLLGVEESSVAGVREVFALDEEECATINPMHQGRGVLISGVERAGVNVLPGAAILAVADTTPLPLQAEVLRRIPPA